MEQTDRQKTFVCPPPSLSFMITTTTIHSFISFSLSESSSGVCNNNDDDFCCRCFCTTDWKTLRLPLLFFVCKRAANPTRVAAADQVLPPRVISEFFISEIIINSFEVIIILKQKKCFFPKKTQSSRRRLRRHKVLSSVCGLSTLFGGRRAFFAARCFCFLDLIFKFFEALKTSTFCFPLIRAHLIRRGSSYPSSSRGEERSGQP